LEGERKLKKKENMIIKNDNGQKQKERLKRKGI
jgi:hypothetical protein